MDEALVHLAGVLDAGDHLLADVAAFGGADGIGFESCFGGEGAPRFYRPGRFEINAKTLVGEPDPPTIFNGAAITIAPVVGNLSRLRS